MTLGKNASLSSNAAELTKLEYVSLYIGGNGRERFYFLRHGDGTARKTCSKKLHLSYFSLGLRLKGPFKKKYVKQNFYQFKRKPTFLKTGVSLAPIRISFSGHMDTMALWYITEALQGHGNKTLPTLQVSWSTRNPHACYLQLFFKANMQALSHNSVVLRPWGLVTKLQLQSRQSWAR